MTTIDIRGLSCPQPALKVSEVLKLNPQNFKIICDLSSPIDTIMKITEHSSYVLYSQDCEEQETTFFFCKNLSS